MEKEIIVRKWHINADTGRIFSMENPIEPIGFQLGLNAAIDEEVKRDWWERDEIKITLKENAKVVHLVENVIFKKNTYIVPVYEVENIQPASKRA
jgi:hypothetical protein